MADLLNTAMYLLGTQTVSLDRLTFSVYDVPVVAVALVLYAFFINTAMHETRRLALLGK